ncbi:hypothetical protein ACSQ67_001054 [Phaseolus vulgaris]
MSEQNHATRKIIRSRSSNSRLSSSLRSPRAELQMHRHCWIRHKCKSIEASNGSLDKMNPKLSDVDAKVSNRPTSDKFLKDVDWQDNDGALNTITMTHLLLAN